MISSIIAIAIAGVLVCLHFFKKINTLEVLIWSYGFQVYHLSLGDTLAPLFFVTLYFSFLEILYILKYRVKVNLSTFFLLIFPVFTFSVVTIIFSYKPTIFEGGSGGLLIFNFVYFYLKFYLPWFLIGHRIFRENYDLDSYFDVFKKVLLTSLAIAYLRTFLYIVAPNPVLLEIIGHTSQFTFEFFGMKFQRMNAFFQEPKTFAYFLGLSIPILYHFKKKKLIMVVMVTGVLTMSGTFLAFIVLYSIIYMIKSLKNLRVRIISAVVGFVMFFFVLEQFMHLVFDYYFGLDSTSVTSLVMKRAVARYDDSNAMAGLSFFGVPLQADLEAPVYLYFIDHPFLFLTGYGPGNANLVYDDYFYGTYAFQSRLDGHHKGHIDMGFFYLTFEFGLIFLLFFISFFSKVKINRKYHLAYIVLLSSIFFFRGELFLIIFYSIAKSSASRELYPSGRSV